MGHDAFGFNIFQTKTVDHYEIVHRADGTSTGQARVDRSESWTITDGIDGSRSVTAGQAGLPLTQEGIDALTLEELAGGAGALIDYFYDDEARVTDATTGVSYTVGHDAFGFNIFQTKTVDTYEIVEKADGTSTGQARVKRSTSWTITDGSDGSRSITAGGLLEAPADAPEDWLDTLTLAQVVELLEKEGAELKYDYDDAARLTAATTSAGAAESGPRVMSTSRGVVGWEAATVAGPVSRSSPSRISRRRTNVSPLTPVRRMASR